MNIPSPTTPARVSRERTGRRTLTALVLAVGVPGALLGLGWYLFTGKEDLAAMRYARQVERLELPRSYELASQERGGTYFAAGNGPSASRGYYTTAAPEQAVAELTAILEEAGYEVERTAKAPYAVAHSGGTGVHLAATGGKGPMEVYVSLGQIYDQPHGVLDARPGHTGVLLVVRDHGRSR